MRMRGTFPERKRWRWFGALALLLFVRTALAGHPEGQEEGSHQMAERSGTLATRDGQRLRLVTDAGNVRVSTGPSGQVSYRVELGTGPGPDAQRLANSFTISARTDSEGVVITASVPNGRRGGLRSVNFKVTVPRNYNLEVTTDGGNIETEDIDGRASLRTAGGNISAGRVGAAARLETGGGHVLVRDVGGDLVASTGGGHIAAGDIGGDAVLRTGGGHIRLGSVKGTARLETGGGNISMVRSGGEVVATTGGGQIELGEAAGSLRVRTGGGGIRVLRVSGPTVLETGGGSIYLTGALNAVRATTGAGGITVWFDPKGKLESGSKLECGQGDIAVYLPRELPITVDAAIEAAGEHEIVVDPSFPLKVSYGGFPGSARVVRAEGPLNGGGQALRLRTVAGDIRLLASEAASALYKQQFDELQRRLDLDRRRLEQQLEELQQRWNQRPKRPEKPQKPENPDD